jgi:hypothetical protein
MARMLDEGGSSEETPGDVGALTEHSRLMCGGWDVVDVALDGSQSGLCCAVFLCSMHIKYVVIRRLHQECTPSSLAPS